MWWVTLGQKPEAHLGAHSFLLLKEDRREKIALKSSWLEIKTAISLTSYCHVQNRLPLVKIKLMAN